MCYIWLGISLIINRDIECYVVSALIIIRFDRLLGQNTLVFTNLKWPNLRKTISQNLPNIYFVSN